MAKVDIDFEKEFLDAANELRGAVSENNYKNYILPLKSTVYVEKFILPIVISKILLPKNLQ